MRHEYDEKEIHTLCIQPEMLRLVAFAVLYCEYEARVRADLLRQ